MADSTVGTRAPGDIYYNRRQVLRASGLSSAAVNAIEDDLDGDEDLYDSTLATSVPAQVGTVTPTDTAEVKIALAWADLDPVPSDGYEVWGRPATAGGVYTLLDTVTDNAYDDVAPNDDVENYYKVRAVEDGINGPFSAVAHVVHDSTA